MTGLGFEHSHAHERRTAFDDDLTALLREKSHWPQSPDERWALLESIVAQQAFLVIDGVMVDITTAGLIVALHAKISPRHQILLKACKVPVMARIAWDALNASQKGPNP